MHSKIPLLSWHLLSDIGCSQWEIPAIRILAMSPPPPFFQDRNFVVGFWLKNVFQIQALYSTTWMWMHACFSIVKAPNFGPHENFGPLFQKSLKSLKRVLQKNEENKSFRKTLDLQIRFCSFLYMIHPKRVQNLQEKVQSFHEVQSWTLLRHYSRVRQAYSLCSKKKRPLQR